MSCCDSQFTLSVSFRGFVCFSSSVGVEDNRIRDAYLNQVFPSVIKAQYNPFKLFARFLRFFNLGKRSYAGALK